MFNPDDNHQRYSAGFPSSLSWFLLIISLVTFGWRLHGLGQQSLWRDEVDSIYFALRDFPETLTMFVQAAQNGPIYFLFLRGWLRLVGTSEFALRYVSLLFSVVSLPLFWRVSRKLMPTQMGVNKSKGKTGRSLWTTIAREPAVLAVLFMSSSPYHLWYAQEGKMYSMVIFLALLAAWFWLNGINIGGWRPWLLFLVTLSLGIYTHLFMVLFIPMTLIWFVLAWSQSKDHLAGYGLSLAGLFLPYLPMIWWQWDMLTSTGIMTSFEFTPFKKVLESVLLYQSYTILPPSNLIWLAPLFIVGLNGMVVGNRLVSLHYQDGLHRLTTARRHLLIITWLIVPVLLIYTVSLRQPVFAPRYVIWIAPALMMLLALGVHMVRQQAGRIGDPLFIALLIYIIAFWMYTGWQQMQQEIKPDLRGAIEYVSQKRSPDELLILQIPYLQVAYRYYSNGQSSNPFEGGDGRLGWWAGGIYTNDGLVDEEARMNARDEMEAKTEDASKIWVVQSESGIWDARGLMMEWLDSNATLIDKVDFNLVQVFEFQME